MHVDTKSYGYEYESYPKTGLKQAYGHADDRYKVDDKIAGFTRPGSSFRRDYKRAGRHARRKVNAEVRGIQAAV